MSLHFEDFETGRRWHTGGRTVTEAEIVGFAAVHDAQRLHLDAAWAAQGPFRGLIASGFQTLALAWSLWLRTGALEDTGRGGIGIDELRWTAPLRPGDTISDLVEVVDRSSVAKRGRGRVVLAHTVSNQRGEVILTFHSICLVASAAEQGGQPSAS